MYDGKNPKNDFNLDDLKVSLTYNPGDLLAVTFKPDDSLQHFKIQSRFQSFYKDVKTLFEPLQNTKIFDNLFHIELSEPIGDNITSKGPRLHLHGILHLKNEYSVFNWLCYVMPRLLNNGILSVKHIKTDKHLSGWTLYITKQVKIMPKNSHITNFIEIDDALKTFHAKLNGA